MKKYKMLDDDYIIVHGRKLYRIVAVRDFSDIKAGEKGGYIEKEKNLSHDGKAWVYDQARVYGDAKVYDNAKVYGNAEVYDKAKVYGNAEVYDKAKVYGEAEAYDNVKVDWLSRVYGCAKVYGNARVCGGRQNEVYGCARVYGNASVGGLSSVFGRAKVHGEAKVQGCAYVFDDAEVAGSAEVCANSIVCGNAKMNFEVIREGFVTGTRHATCHDAETGDNANTRDYIVIDGKIAAYGKTRKCGDVYVLREE